VEPRLYVYGKPEHADVQIAKQIASGESLALDVIDKDDRAPLSPIDLPTQVEQAYYAQDLYPWGGLFSGWAETAERMRRAAAGRLMLHGGGGEILRNFFYLLNGRYSAEQLVATFYSQFDPRACVTNEDVVHYRQVMAGKMRDLVGGGQSSFARPTIEWLYHNFRCRSWDGQVDSLNNRYGFTAQLFLERRLTNFASAVPIGLKHHGALEAAIIRRIDPRLAAYSSSYGHDFSGPPPLSRKLTDYATYIRPTWLRRFTYRLKRGHAAGAHVGYLAGPYVASVLPNGVDTMRRIFCIDRNLDPAHMDRVLTLEYITQRIGSKLRIEEPTNAAPRS
jgi:hypothetical protein